MSLTPGTRLALRPFGRLRVAPSHVEGRQAQGDLEQRRKVGVYDITALGRQVAIKILPEAFAADPERLAPVGDSFRSVERLVCDGSFSEGS